MFEGTGPQARQYTRWFIYSIRGIVFEGRVQEPSYAKIMRHGKTARDAASGAPGRRIANREARGAWCQAVITGKGRAREPFPLEVCNGRDSRALRAANKRKPRAKGKRT